MLIYIYILWLFSLSFKSVNIISICIIFFFHFLHELLTFIVFCSVYFFGLYRTAFNEYQLCVDKRGRNDVMCLQRGRDYSTVCPEKWVEDWKNDTEKGVSMSVGTSFIRGE